MFFYRRIRIPSALITIKHDGNFKHPSVPGEVNKTNGIIDPLWLPHIDSNKHILKALVLLDDISLENGPTGIISGSNRDKLFRNFYKFVNVFFLYNDQSISLHFLFLLLLRLFYFGSFLMFKTNICLV